MATRMNGMKEGEREGDTNKMSQEDRERVRKRGRERELKVDKMK